MIKKIVFLFSFLPLSSCAQDFNALLKEVLSAVKQIEETLFKPSVEQLPKKADSAEISYKLAVALEIPFVNQLHELLNTIKNHPDVKKSKKIPEFLVVWRKTVSEGQLEATLNDLADKFEKSAQETVTLKVDFGNSEDLFLFYKTPFNPLTDELLIASTREAFEKGLEPGFLHKHIGIGKGTEAEAAEKLKEIQDALEKSLKTVEQSTFSVFIKGPNKAWKVTLNGAGREWASRLYKQITHPTQEEPKEYSLE